MAIDKRVSYTMQGHKKPARNYLGKQKTVKDIPIKWKSGPKAPATELAYITKAEKDLIIKKDLHGSLKHGPNTGPDGVMSLDEQGDYSPDRSPSGGGGGGGGGGDSEAQNIAAQNAARQKAVLTGRIQRDPITGNWEAGRNLGRRDSLAGIGLGQGNIGIGRSIRSDLGGRRSRLSGILGALGRGALSIFGGIPGKIASGFMTASDWAKRKGTGVMQGVGEFGDTDEEGNPLYPTWDRFINRNTGKYDDKPYRGQGQGYDFNEQDTAAEGGRIGYQEGKNYEYNVLAGKGYKDMMEGMSAEEIGALFDSVIGTFSQNKAEGGRIGYQGGELVEDASMVEATPAGLMEENIEEVQGEPSREQLEAIAFEIFQLPLEQLDEEQLMVVYQAAMEQEPYQEDIQFAEEGPAEGIASLV